MGSLQRIVAICLTLLAACAFAVAADFEWNFRNQQVIGRTDSSLGNTSRLSEGQRNELIDAIVLRLQKPMAEHGYDDDRIREIASTTRLRFVDLGDGKPVVFATSLGIEGGCDSLNNCPLWIFRQDGDGYVSMLDTFGATYTMQPDTDGGFADLVIARHTSATETTLTLYRYSDGKYQDAGCYKAVFPPPKDDEIQDPEITPCKPEESAK